MKATIAGFKEYDLLEQTLKTKNLLLQPTYATGDVVEIIDMHPVLLPTSPKKRPGPSASDIEASKMYDEDLRRTRYEEAGHAVVGYILGFKPMYIDGPLTMHDRRSTAFLRVARPLHTSGNRERFADFACYTIAGPAAQAKARGVPLCDLREESNVTDEHGSEGDYKWVNGHLDALFYSNLFEMNDQVRDARLNLWEARAIAMVDNPMVWAAIESVVEALELNFEQLFGKDLISVIERGLRRFPLVAGVPAAA